MSIRTTSRLTLAGLLLATAGSVTALAASAPDAVSPGATDRATRVEQRCPTFSWGAVRDAEAYELLVFDLPEGFAQTPAAWSNDPSQLEPALRVLLPGTVTSWTPGLGQCFAAGSDHAWVVRASGVGEKPQWSPARLFSIETPPALESVDEALAVLRRHLERGTLRPDAEQHLAGLLGAPHRSGRSAPAEPPPSLLPRGNSDETDPAALHAELPDTNGRTIGVRGITHSTTSSSAGILGWATGTSGAVVGVLGKSASPIGLGVAGVGHYGVQGFANSPNGAAVYGDGRFGDSSGVLGQAESGLGYGVHGRNESTTGGAYGVFGESQSSSGVGVQGEAATGVQGASTTTFGIGVRGESAFGTGVLGYTNAGIGVYGSADNASGVITGVYGETTSADGRGVYARGHGAAIALRAESTSGNHIEAYNSTFSRVFYVDNDGDVFADRSYNCGLASGCFNAGAGADVAERIDVTEALEPGDVVEIDPARPGHFRRSRERYSPLVAGIVSTQPAITLNNDDLADYDGGERTDVRPLLALAGRVPVKASAENGPIRPGDPLTTASIPGYAARCNGTRRCFGRTIGKALEPLAEGTGLVLTIVSLQ